MINLRYHIVSLVAVFLALTLGIIVGTTVIDQQIVAGLRAQRDRDVAAIRALEDQSESLQLELALWDRFGASVVPPMLRAELRGADVVFLVEERADESLVRVAGDAVVAAGGARAGRIVFQAKWKLEDETAREQLALALGETESDAPRLRTEAAARLAARLQTARDTSDSADLLSGLARAGFIAIAETGEGPFPPRGAFLIWVSAGSPDVQPDHAGFTVPFLRALGGGIPTAVVEPLSPAASLVERVRGDQQTRQEVLTVDHVATWPGRLALVLGLRDLAAGHPAEHYGVRRGADALAPGLP